MYKPTEGVRMSDLKDEQGLESPGGCAFTGLVSESPGKSNPQPGEEQRSHGKKTGLQAERQQRAKAPD